MSEVKEIQERPVTVKPVMMTVAELAAVSKLSESFWYQAICDGRCPHYRFGKGQGGIRVSVEQYEAFLKSIERLGSPAPEPPKKKYRHLT